MITRRNLLVGSALVPGLQSFALGQLSGPLPAQNASYPLSSIDGLVTPPDLFFVRDHFHEPVISIADWRLKVEGRVARPLQLSLADILESAMTEVECVLECAGNAPGGSAASNGVWEGIPLKEILKQAGAAPDAVAVLLEGADHGRLGTDLPDAPYCQLVPIKKCQQPQSLLAVKLNGRVLPRRNGFPARALLPGWYAMDSVKWLQRIVVMGPSDQSAAFQSSGMADLYNRVRVNPAGGKQVARLTDIQLKSAIAWPPNQTNLPVGTHVVSGFAWTGRGVVRSVKLSVDGGATWAAAQLETPSKPLTWVRWKSPWAAVTGEHVLMSRAFDDSGGEQPLVREAGRRDGYEMNFSERIRCSVR